NNETKRGLCSRIGALVAGEEGGGCQGRPAVGLVVGAPPGRMRMLEADGRRRDDDCVGRAMGGHARGGWTARREWGQRATRQWRMRTVEAEGTRKDDDGVGRSMAVHARGGWTARKEWDLRATRRWRQWILQRPSNAWCSSGAPGSCGRLSVSAVCAR